MLWMKAVFMQYHDHNTQLRIKHFHLKTHLENDWNAANHRNDYEKSNGTITMNMNGTGTFSSSMQHAYRITVDCSKYIL